MIQTATFWLVLLAAFVSFWLIPARWRLGFLAAASFGYLVSLAPLSMIALVGWTLVFYHIAPLAAQPGPWQRRATPFLILAILAYLAYFKYIPPLIAAVASTETERLYIIPLGISYYSFKFVHYAIEVGRGNVRDRSMQAFFCYIFLFPIFTAGPIERFDHFIGSRPARLAGTDVIDGLTRIAHGLIKKFFVAEMIVRPLMRGVSVPELLAMLEAQPTYKVWGYLALSYLYLYMDFSAYTDIAIGASRLFGLRIMENFNMPVLATSIGNFWKRWHMTLAGWCQAYVYMPILGLSRNPYLAVYATFTVMALWHAGALNWLCWGWYHATGVIVFLTWNRIKRKRRWHALERNLLYRLAGLPATFVFVTGSYSFTVTYGHGGMRSALRLFAKLFFVNLPD